MLVGVIVGCEIGFWVLLGLGLLLRYGLRLRRVSTGVLTCVPLVDLVLLVTAVLDLRHGGNATAAHGLAAIYIGCSVAWGHRMIAWADRWAAHRLAGGPRPQRAPRKGVAHARRERAEWYRHVRAWAVGCALLLGAVALVGDASRTQTLLGMAGVWTLVLAIDGVISFSYTLWPRRA